MTRFLLLAITIIFLSAGPEILAVESSIKINSSVSGNSESSITTSVRTNSNESGTQTHIVEYRNGEKVRDEHSTDSTIALQIEDKKTALQEKIDARQAQLQNRLDDTQDKVASKQAEMRARLTEEKQKQVTYLYQLMMKRFRAAHARLVNFVDRLDSRITKMKEADSNLSIASWQKQLEEIKGDLNALEDAILDAEKEIDPVSQSENPKALYVILKEDVKTIRPQIVAIHEKIRVLILAIAKESSE